MIWKRVLQALGRPALGPSWRTAVVKQQPLVQQLLQPLPQAPAQA